jgi:hypothetical protein
MSFFEDWESEDRRYGDTMKTIAKVVWSLALLAIVLVVVRVLIGDLP